MSAAIVLLFLWSVTAAIYGALVFVRSGSGVGSAIYEIEAGIAFLIATVSIGAAFIVEAINQLKQKIEDTYEEKVEDDELG